MDSIKIFFISIGLILFTSYGCNNKSEESFIQFGLLYGTYMQNSAREEKFIAKMDSCLTIIRKDNGNTINLSQTQQLKEMYKSNQIDLERDLSVLDTLKVTPDLRTLKSTFQDYLKLYRINAKRYFPLDIKLLENGGKLSAAEIRLLQNAKPDFMETSNLEKRLTSQFKKYYSENDLSIMSNTK